MPDHKFRPGQLVNLSAVLIPGSPHMCARCIEIDDQTDRYRELAEYVRDPAAQEAIVRLIANLAVKKLGLHTEPERRLGEGLGRVHGQDEA